ncbi:MAG: TolC family protein [Gammaproteobacteria bacterium]
MRQHLLKLLALALAALMLSACASYQALPLNDHPLLPDNLSQLRVDARKLPFPHLASYTIDPGNGLDITEIAILAVLNNPELQLARANAHIAHAQAFAAGLLPDPQFNLARDFPVHKAAGVTTAYNAGIAYDLNSLISHAAKSDAGKANLRKTNLDLLWQEWQVIARARVLFTRAITQTRLLAWLTRKADLLQAQYRKSKVALSQGNMTVIATDSALIAWQDAERQRNDLQRRQAKTRHQLDNLLGLAPTVQLKLVDDLKLAPLSNANVEQALRQLPQRRPDLLALKAGYAAQDARYRQAILNQFPAFNLGLNKARDTGGIITHGFTLALTLPIFDGNRGNIAIAKATRQRLHDEYEIRLNRARSKVLRLLADRKLLQNQLKTITQHLPELDRAANRARAALASGSLDTAAFVSFESVRIAKHIEAANLKQSLQENRIALLTLIGGDFPQRIAEKTQ